MAPVPQGYRRPRCRMRSELLEEQTRLSIWRTYPDQHRPRQCRHARLDRLIHFLVRCRADFVAPKTNFIKNRTQIDRPRIERKVGRNGNVYAVIQCKTGGNPFCDHRLQ